MIIFSHGGSQWEGWLYINDAGQLVYHFENDGAKFLRKGPQASDEIMTFSEALAQFPEYAREIKAAEEQLQNPI